MITTTETVAETAIATAAAVVPALVATDPKAAAVLALAPIVLQMVQAATQLQQAGSISSADLASIYALAGRGLQSTHDTWAAMNAAAK